MKNLLEQKNHGTLFSFNNLINYSGKIEFPQLYLALNNEFPNIISCNDYINTGKLMELLVNQFKVKTKNLWTSHSISKYNEVNPRLSSFLIHLKDDFLVGFDSYDNCVMILYSDAIQKAELDVVTELIKQCHEETATEGKIFLLYAANDYLYLQDFAVNKSEIDINLNYNDDFLPINDKIVKRLNTQNDKGLVLLHGQPGTGKTSYIRYLTAQTDKKLIYIPPDYADKIASPNFLPLMISNPNSVLIIEDAESIIESRESGRNAAVSSLLNVADGLLSDCLNLQILCTFNTQISKIDQALLRKGRLIADYEFGALETKKAQKLSNTLGFKSKIKSPMTLADIYNQEEKENIEHLVEKPNVSNRNKPSKS